MKRSCYETTAVCRVFNTNRTSLYSELAVTILILAVDYLQAQPEEEPKRGAILKRSMTFSPEPFRASPLEGDPPSVGAASGATEQHATTRKASLKIVIGSDETRTGELGNGVAGQSGGEVGAVTKVPYSSKYRCLFIEA